MNIIVTAGLSNYKLRTTLAPLVQIDEVKKVYLVRREPLDYEKVINCNPPKFIRKFLYLAEIWRLCTILLLCAFRKIDRLVGIHYQYHCIFVAIAGLIFNKPYLFSIIEEPMIYKNNKRFFKLAQKSSGIGVRGSNSKKFLEGSLDFKKEKIFIVPDYFPFKEQLKQRVSYNRKNQFIYVGDFVKEKRIDILLDIFESIKNDGIEFDADVIGEGPLSNQMHQRAQDKGLTNHVKFHGFVRDIYSHFCDASIMILSSDTEGLPTVLMEAMSCGVVCIVPDVGDITDLAIDGYNALVVEALNIEQYKQAAKKLLSDQELWKELSDNALKIHEEKEKEYSLLNVSSIWKKALIRP